jgi:hypothetical protein
MVCPLSTKPSRHESGQNICHAKIEVRVRVEHEGGETRWGCPALMVLAGQVIRVELRPGKDIDKEGLHLPSKFLPGLFILLRMVLTWRRDREK